MDGEPVDKPKPEEFGLSTERVEFLNDPVEASGALGLLFEI